MFKRLDANSLSKRKEKLVEAQFDLKSDITQAISQVEVSINNLQVERTELAKLHGSF